MSSFFSSLIAATIGGLISMGIAWRLFKAERGSRLAERNEDQHRQLQGMRGASAGRLIHALRPWANGERPLDSIDPYNDIDEALMYLLHDGTENSLTMNYWVQMMLTKVTPEEGKPLNIFQTRQTFELIRVTLIAWVREEPGTIINAKRALENYAKENAPASDVV